MCSTLGQGPSQQRAVPWIPVEGDETWLDVRLWLPFFSRMVFACGADEDDEHDTAAGLAPPDTPGGGGVCPRSAGPAAAGSVRGRLRPQPRGADCRQGSGSRLRSRLDFQGERPFEAGNSQFTATDTFRADAFSISSYSSTGDDYDSVLAHGIVDNLIITAQLQPITRLTGGLGTNDLWQTQFFAHSNWLYTLERTSDFTSWTQASSPTGGANGSMSLLDTNVPMPKAFYRIRANRP